MTKKMLIDAAHPEEVRVAVLGQNRVEDFDFESAARKPLRGNIYLARVTRVEPSLQAAFVEYGGNRHGFLAFSEIHPDYYQIPVADRERLQAAEAEVADLAAQLELAQRGDDEDDDDTVADDDETNGEETAEASEEDGVETVAAEAVSDDTADEETPADQKENDADTPLIEDENPAPSDNDAPSGEIDEDEKEEEEEEEDVKEDGPNKKSSVAAAIDQPETQAKETTDANNDVDEESSTDTSEQTEALEATDSADNVADAETAEETVAENEAPDVEAADEEGDAGESTDDSEDEDDVVVEEDEAANDEAENDEDNKKNARSARDKLFERYKDAKRKRSQLLRNYKIQEVIKRRQILLIQVVKEERGNKGAALTTYLSLAGRYCVLMPNTARGGGISRKIPNGTDRRRLRRVVDSLEVPQGMGLIIRTAGAKRTKTEIKRDYEYLLRLWENIRTLTLKSIAPCLIYEEASLIKRAIRDLYDKDISKVMVEGEAGYREAKDFMKMLMPSHAKHVQPYKERAPIFLKHGVETQLDGMYQPSVRLKSGGYIVIHQTEALVAIDVNSGRATRERNIELTALKTNIEAAQEAARQFRLRDLAGLIVIDFIDMEEPKNNRKVEKALKEALKADRARIQVGRISSFGLLEMSRQRRRSGIVDGTTHTCPTCSGAGVIRSQEMAALRILRAIEGEAISGKVGKIAARASVDVSLYLLNHHRDWLKRIETDNGVSIEVIADTEKAGDAYDLEKSGAPRPVAENEQVVRADQTEAIEADDEAEVEAAEEQPEQEKEGGRKRRRRRRRKKDPSANNDEMEASETSADSNDAAAESEESRADSNSDSDHDGDGEKPKRRRRRGRRGGRRNRQATDNEATSQDADGAENADAPKEADAPDVAEADTGSTEQPSVVEDDQDAAVSKTVVETAADNAVVEESAKDELIEATPNAVEDEPLTNGADQSPVEDEPEPAPENAAPEAPVETKPKKPARKGWWQRATGS